MTPPLTGTPVTPLRRYAPPLVLLAITAAFTISAFGFPPVSRQVPILVGLLTTVLLILDLLSRTPTAIGATIQRLLNPDSAEATGVVEDAPPQVREIMAILWICAFAGLTMLIGFSLAIPVYLAGYMLIQGRFALRKTALVTAGFSLGTWLLFEIGLNYRLYGGILFD